MLVVRLLRNYNPNWNNNNLSIRHNCAFFITNNTIFLHFLYTYFHLQGFDIQMSESKFWNILCICFLCFFIFFLLYFYRYQMKHFYYLFVISQIAAYSSFNVFVCFLFFFSSSISIRQHRFLINTMNLKIELKILCFANCSRYGVEQVFAVASRAAVSYLSTNTSTIHAHNWCL